jgi:hypothetical protein
VKKDITFENRFVLMFSIENEYITLHHPRVHRSTRREGSIVLEKLYSILGMLSKAGHTSNNDGRSETMIR